MVKLLEMTADGLIEKHREGTSVTFSAPVLKTADKIIDTSDLNVHELKQLLKVYFQYLIPDQSLQITLVSFENKKHL